MLQMPLFEPRSDWTPPEVLPDLRGATVIGYDLETRDPNLRKKGPGFVRRDGEVVGISLSWRREGDRGSVYLPFGHDGGGNLDRKLVVGYVADVMKNFEGELVGANLMYDVGWGLTEDIQFDFDKTRFVDVQWAEALIDENQRSYSLESIAKRRGIENKAESVLREAASAWGVDPKNQLWMLHSKYVGAYGERDAELPIEIWGEQRVDMDRDDLWRVWELETSLFETLVRMRLRGVRVDMSLAERMRKSLRREEREHLDAIARLTGRAVNVWSDELADVLEKQRGISVPRTPAGNYSTTAEWLESLDDEVAALAVAARKANRAWSGGVEGKVLDHAVHHGDEWRVHCEFHPLKGDEGGTVSGRFSSSNPSLQNVLLMIRHLFLPERGQRWGMLDYSQQEPRLTIHFANAIGLRGARAAVEEFTRDPRTDYHQMVADFAGIERKPAKTLNLGIAYGMGGVKLCHRLGLPTKFVTSRRTGRTIEVAGDEGDALMRRYDDRVPFIKLLLNKCANRAAERGQIRTIGGRLCRFPLWEPATRGQRRRPLPYDLAVEKYGLPLKRAYTHKSMNRLIQGSAADMIKAAMREVGRLTTPLVTVHDELGLSVESEEEARRYGEVMESCMPLSVPLVVDEVLGDSWGDAKERAES